MERQRAAKIVGSGLGMSPAISSVVQGMVEGVPTTDLGRGVPLEHAPSPKHVAVQGLPQPEWHFVLNTPPWISHEFVWLIFFL